MEKSIEGPLKKKIELPYDPAILPLSIYPDKTAMLITISKTWKQLKCPSTDEWIKKMWYVCLCVYTHTHTPEYYSAIKKNEIMPFAATWMDLVITILSVVSQKEKQLSS